MGESSDKRNGPASGTPASPSSGESPAQVPASASPIGQPLPGTQFLDTSNDLVPGSRISRYWIVEQLGAGGMGTVYRAYDPDLNRRVALKLLPVHEARSARSERKRLQREAQALAQVTHRNVVAVHDVGTTEVGDVFIAMEYVDGKNIKMYSEGKSWREVLEVYRGAAAGLAACHQRGLVHRDFKPQNVLVDKGGRAVILDFGLALGVSEEMVTAHGIAQQDTVASVLLTRTDHGGTSSLLASAATMSGTPAYMSPEQFNETEVDAASDQFSFCVALYESLYGERPFGRPEGVLALAHRVLNGQVEEAPRNTRVPGWVRSVLLRGLRVNPTQRWPSMEALLQALSRDPTQRRRVRMGAGVAALLLIAAAGAYLHQRARVADRCDDAGTTVEAVWNPQQAERITAAFGQANIAYAPKTWTHAKQHVDAYALRWTEARAQVCRESLVEGKRSEDMFARAWSCLDDEKDQLAALVELWLHPDARVVQQTVTAATALPSPDRCLDEAELKRRPQDVGDSGMKQSWRELRRRLSRTEAMLHAGHYDEGLALSQSVLADAEDLGAQPFILRARVDVGRAQMNLGRYDAAEKTFERAFQDAMIAGDDVTALGVGNRLMFVVGYRLSRPDDGERWYWLSKILQERLGLGADDWRVADLEYNHAILLRKLGNYSAAFSDLQRVLSVYERNLGPDHLRTANTLNSIGIVQARQGREREALETFQRGLAIREANLGHEHPDLGQSLNNVAEMQQRLGQRKQAIESYERALKIFEARLGGAHPHTAVIQHNIGDVYRKLGRHDEALKYFGIALTKLQRKLGDSHPLLAYPLTGIGRSRLSRRDYRRALPPLQRALEIRRKNPGESVLLGETLFATGRAYWESGQNKQLGLQLAQEALAAYRELPSGAVRDEVVTIEAWLSKRGQSIATPKSRLKP